MNVLSLFDGISAGRLALQRAELEVTKYYRSEIDKYASQVAMHHYPDDVQLGDVTKWREWDIDWSSIDLLIGGSPCQGFSFAGKGVDAEKLQDSPIVSELPELEIKYSDAVKSTDPTNDNQACASGGASSNDYQLNAKRDNAFLVAQLLSNNKISAELRKKAETKMTALLDELI